MRERAMTRSVDTMGSGLVKRPWRPAKDVMFPYCACVNLIQAHVLLPVAGHRQCLHVSVLIGFDGIPVLNLPTVRPAMTIHS